MSSDLQSIKPDQQALSPFIQLLQTQFLIAEVPGSKVPFKYLTDDWVFLLTDWKV